MVRPARRHLASIGAVAILGAVTASAAGCFFDDPAPPKPVSNWTLTDARGFDEFDLYWLGDSYQGLPLTSMLLTKDGDDVKHASFFYGEPSLAGDSGGSWLPPLEVDIQPYCGFNPGEAESAYGDEFKPLEIGGAPGYLYDDFGLFLWSGASTIALDRWKSNVDLAQAGQDLIPVAQDRGAPLNPLPSPTSTKC